MQKSVRFRMFFLCDFAHSTQRNYAYLCKNKQSVMEKKGKILIVDDNQDVLFALNLLLEPYVEKVKVTTQPSRIEHFMKVFEPDVILLDMNFRKDASADKKGLTACKRFLPSTPKPWCFS